MTMTNDKMLSGGLRLSPHFSLGELCKTSHKTADGNIPSRVAIENLRNLCENWLEDLRYSYNTLFQPHVISSDQPVISSGVEKSLERSPEISPCAPLSRDDKGGVISSDQPVISSKVEKSPERSPEISPCAALSRDDKGIIINSGYRSPEVNRLAGGAATSNHLTGCAVDIHVSGFEQAIRYASILLDISEGTKRDYDELFIERNKAGSHWIHFAVRPKDNRRKAGFIQT